MGTITHTFDAGQAIWIITTATATCGSAIRAGTVIQVRATGLITGTNVAYDVRLGSDPGSTTVLEDNMFATLAAAVAEYEIRLS